jgi:RHS repeat-associated protein
VGKSVTAGSAPVLSVSVDPATNRVVGQTYDANGNTGGPSYYSFDVENRMILGPDYVTTYVYDHAGKRVKKASGTSWELYFYGIGGQKLVTQACTSSGCTAAPQYNVYFGGKLVKSKGVLVVTDRLGSVRASGYERMSYYPYGEEKTSTADGREKFGTYTRDNPATDYADQRYYAVGMGRFQTPDPYRNSAGPGDPGSWNRYAYVGGDPINFGDPSGRIRMSCDDPGADGIYDGSCNPASDQWFDGCGGANLLDDPDNPNPNPACYAPVPGPGPAPAKIVPAYLGVANVSVLPCNRPNAPHPPGQDFGIQISITYQVMGSDDQPFQQAGLVPNESITGETGTTPNGRQFQVPNRSGPLGKPTNSQGQFMDSPFGSCTSASYIGAKVTGTQTISMVGPGGTNTVQTANFQLLITGPGKGTVSFTMPGGFASFIYRSVP